MSKALEGNSVYRLDPKNVLHQNSLQVIYAERQVYSRIPDFSMAKEMVEADTELRTGPRFTMAP